MSWFALDASTVLTWCFPDEEAQKAHEISERIAGGDTVIVPAFWRREILNALRHGLTACDAAYLEVAIRGGHPLATADDELKRAADAEGVQAL